MNNLLQKLISNPGSLKKEESEKLLEELRQEVNDIDIQIGHLLLHRIKTGFYIARVKRLLKLPSYSPEREEKILESILSLTSDDQSRKILKNIYERIIDESRGIQKLRTDDE